MPLLFEDYAADMVKRVAARSAKQVLEIAAGTGVVTRAMAKGLPAGTAIVATDLNPAMLEQAEAMPATPKRSVVCGLTIIEGDTSIDPKMAKAPSKSEGIAHTIRSIDPPIWKP